MSENGVILSADEVTALALRMTVQHLEFGEWPEWGLVPELDEQSYLMLVDAVVDVAHRVSNMSRQFDLAHDIDSAYLQERAT